ncbi:hypothetical protein EC396_09170 [Lutibacter sp. HS1-25]|uniref:hypothetical protein n=1 Tax=Lutibacter sp. HS1-25 TaxID=2485000 RepID=UPI00101113A8|nr:hypothetical protein [Lutibacter sp. HS1-25]RXP54542.1 hypothetical protein EC396_09170 [Lutibacter sp. HS1-25]
MDSIKKISRKELYILIWKTSITTIAKEHNIPADTIRNICKKLEIPTPSSGYWSKLKFNKKVEIPPLPKIKDDDKETGLKLVEGKLTYQEHPQTTLSLIKKEIKSEPTISYTVPNKLMKPHKFIIATKLHHEKVQIRTKKRDWNMVIDYTNVLSINVSDNLFPRALRFMDTLVKIIEKRGYKLEVPHRTTVTIKNHSYHLRLTEKNKRVKRETDYSWDSFDLVPTGNLSLKIDQLYPIKEWSDSKTKKLEDKLIDILAWLELRAKKDEQEKIEMDIWHRQQAKIRAKKEALQKKKDEEFSKFESLFQTATRWHKSQYIRNYIKEFKEYTIKTNTLDKVKKEWIDWAIEKADWYDPFIEKNVELLEDIDRETLKPKKKSYW